MSTTRTARVTITVGALIRRRVRAGFDQIGVTWIEHKGLLDSSFVVTGTEDQMRTLTRWIESIKTPKENHA